ncbi:hypothetical protein E4P40_20410 [Blastococcus sp. CT_GayMR20]|uniref:hypothetical protein n=1 Tax=Blastococcus sp. CT_GayMR20 TaxID=2559609 RepID=UPI0010732210|nr:hypothetical protein [Blastococcus sp. CT_GayMR20]TFV72624.1 hypothetical protein E4P40_20385 [Blastococcus sp. CT_GayMR20]TFV72629.1 hypothetical protein E4P40_20410 [Blastococcus sp. CT_GayMR20]
MDDPRVPDACTLPTAEQPVRIAEFGDLFAAGLRRVDRAGPTHLVLAFDPSRVAADTVRDLAARESLCCSFFTFTVTEPPGELVLDVVVPQARVPVLDGLAAMARRGA